MYLYTFVVGPPLQSKPRGGGAPGINHLFQSFKFWYSQKYCKYYYLGICDISNIWSSNHVSKKKRSKTQDQNLVLHFHLLQTKLDTICRNSDAYHQKRLENASQYHDMYHSIENLHKAQRMPGNLVLSRFCSIQKQFRVEICNANSLWAKTLTCLKCSFWNALNAVLWTLGLKQQIHNGKNGASKIQFSITCNATHPKYNRTANSVNSKPTNQNSHAWNIEIDLTERRTIERICPNSLFEHGQVISTKRYPANVWFVMMYAETGMVSFCTKKPGQTWLGAGDPWKWWGREGSVNLAQHRHAIWR